VQNIFIIDELSTSRVKQVGCVINLTLAQSTKFGANHSNVCSSTFRFASYAKHIESTEKHC